MTLRNKWSAPGRGRAVAFAMIASLAATAARAEVVVLGSDTATFTSGTTLADGSTLSVPAGASVRILLPSGRTQLVKGPFTAAVKDLGKGEARNDALVGQIRQMVASRGGGPQRPAMRGPAPPSAAAAGIGFSWREVPVDAGGDYCVERGAPLALLRPGSGSTARVTVVDVQEGKRVEATFADGKATAPWPQAITPKVGAFAFLMQDRPMQQVRLRLISPLPEKEQMLRVLHGQRCQRQMEALVRAMQDPKY